MSQTKINFYFDPGCPWCWNTSRWIKEVQKSRDLSINWKSFSLYIKNKDTMSEKYLKKSIITHRMLRLIEAAREKYGDTVVDDLYTKFGILVHYKKKTTDKDIKDVLSTTYDTKYLLSTLDDNSWDKNILNSMQDAFDVVGNDIGTPIITFKSNKKEVGYFGPIITKVPIGRKALLLWDNFSGLCQYEDFYEIKRTRKENPHLPDIVSY